MTLFRYKALTAAGRTISGELEAPDRESVLGRLQDLGHWPIEAAPSSSLSRLRRGLSLRRRRLSSADLALLSQQLARLLRAGLPLERALEIVIGLLAGRPSQRIMGAILARVRDGASLGEAMGPPETAFPRVYVNMVHAGEIAGTPAETLRRLALFLEKSEARRQAVLSALIYPAMLAIVAAGAIAIVVGLVLPQFRPLFAESGVALPLPMRLLMETGDLLGRGWQAIPLGFLCAVAGWKRLMARPAAAWQAFPEIVERVAFARTGQAAEETIEIPANPVTIRFFPDGSATRTRLVLAHGDDRYDLGVDWLTGRITLAH